jgi:hypothetical protein
LGNETPAEEELAPMDYGLISNFAGTAILAVGRRQRFHIFSSPIAGPSKLTSSNATTTKESLAFDVQVWHTPCIPAAVEVNWQSCAATVKGN